MSLILFVTRIKLTYLSVATLTLPVLLVLILRWGGDGMGHSVLEKNRREALCSWLKGI